MIKTQSEMAETWKLVLELRNSLAAAMRILAAAGKSDEFLEEAASIGIEDGIGVRSENWLRQHFSAKKTAP